MVSAEDFIQCPKSDAHSHLNLGMRYAAYVKWAGFYIPDFPRKLNGPDDLCSNIIIPYTQPRIRTYSDVESVCAMAIQDAIADNIKVLEGSIDVQFVDQCGGIDNFITLTKNLVEQFKDRIMFRLDLGLGRTCSQEKIQQCVEPVLRSGVFKAIDIYGSEVEDSLDFFVPVYRLAEQLGIKKKAHAGEFGSARSVQLFVEKLNLDEIQHGISAAQDKTVLDFLAAHDIVCNVCPESNIVMGSVASYKEHPVRKMVDAGVRVSISTGNLLLFNKSVSEQCADLVNAGLFTAEEVKTLLRQNYERLYKSA